MKVPGMRSKSKKEPPQSIPSSKEQMTGRVESGYLSALMFAFRRTARVHLPSLLQQPHSLSDFCFPSSRLQGEDTRLRRYLCFRVPREPSGVQLLSRSQVTAASHRTGTWSGPACRSGDAGRRLLLNMRGSSRTVCASSELLPSWRLRVVHHRYCSLVCRAPRHNAGHNREVCGCCVEWS